MSTYESAYKSQLQGVSQQLPQERLPGQLTAQVNMLSDPVTNLRRRPGAQYCADWAWTDADDSHVLGWFMDIAGARVHILLNTNTGNIRIMDETFTEEANLDGAPYLIAPQSSSVRAVSVGEELYFCNTGITPTVLHESDRTDPINEGFFYVLSGAFGTYYATYITSIKETSSFGGDYDTPNGTGGGDAALSRPDVIAAAIVGDMEAVGAGNPMRNVELQSVEIENFGSSSMVMQRNTGTVAAPVWTNVTAFPYTAHSANYYKTQMRFVGTTATAGLMNSSRFRLHYRYDTEMAPGTWQAVRTSDWFYLHAKPGEDHVMVARQAMLTTDSAIIPGANIPFIVRREGAFVYVARAGGVRLSQYTGSNLMITSKAGSVRNIGELPSQLPSYADGYTVQVGNDNAAPQYYQYQESTTSWIEVAKYGSPSGIRNMPISIYWNGSAWAINKADFDGRFAGDDESNESHAFATEGLSGMGTYQGRLVLLSGPMVSLSAAGKPRQFYRSTVTNLINSDPIEIGSSMNSAASYEWAVSFQKDLLLFSRAYQAVLPSGNTAVTPATATVVPTSSHDVDTTSGPVTLGRTLMYCNPRSSNFFGILEMIPSNYTDSQYVSQDSTPHLPKYMSGRCRFALSSGVANMALFAPSGDPNSLIVHEYQWDGDTKVQQAWHQWSFKYPVATAYFAVDVVILVFVRNGRTVLCTMDTRAGNADADGRLPFLDMNVPVDIVDHEVVIPAWMLTFDPTIADSLVLAARTGELVGEAIGATPNDDGDGLVTVLSWEDGEARMGVPYYSGVIPTPPVVTDYNGAVIHSGKATLLRYLVGTHDSSAFEVKVTDAYSDDEGSEVPVLTFSSPALELGRGLYSSQSVSIVPCRTDLRTTSMELWTEGTGELNVTSLEYVAKFNPKIKRR